MNFEQGKKLTAELLEHLIKQLEKQGFDVLHSMPVMLHSLFVTYSLVKAIDPRVAEVGLNTMQSFINDKKGLKKDKKDKKDQGSKEKGGNKWAM